MSILQRYYFRQALWPFLTAIITLSGLAILTQSLSNFDLISSHGESALIFFWITLLAMPQLISLLIPIALFIGAMMAFNRMSAESELIVGAAAGMSRMQRISPILRLGIYVFLANLAINLFIQPLAYREMRRVVYEVRTDIASSFMRPGEFVPLGDNVTFFARAVTPNGIMEDVFIQDGRGSTSSSYAAKEGFIAQTDFAPVMRLSDGVLTQIDEQGHLSDLTFETYEFDLTGFIDITSTFYFKESDRYLSELLDPRQTDILRAGGKAPLFAEGHYRLASPLYNLVFVLFVAAVFVGSEHRRTGYSQLIILAGVFALLLRLVGFAVQSGATDETDLNALQYGIPLLGAGLAIWRITRPRRKPKGLECGFDPASAPQTPETRS
ncbi:LptF/LptG family permease [Woodsholea maritima]|uniref:LptF/LptG family permease n=1 Tax=Woodsholea maritima TaxID=240237 RepID=UPI0003785B0E|nr:LptF/LptG family permease [Woodsholea maritima]